MTRHLPEQARRDQILSAARRCFIEGGFHPTRMDDIARAANLSKGGIYFHFKSKQEVFDCLVNEEYVRSMDTIRTVREGSGSVQQKLGALGQHYLEYFSTAPDAPRFFIVMGEMGLRDQKLAARLLEMQSAFITEIGKLLDQGIEEGVFRPVDTAVVAAILKALVDGVEGLQALNYPMDLPRYLAAGMSVIMNGLVARPA
ncbi:MAG: TetR/AcrR family transcriptional regulator [Deltaproteobacteria bacterium]|nr:TetR/AcrR family transcriptional regulator [Deltaproteobacteria bacterium]